MTLILVINSICEPDPELPLPTCSHATQIFALSRAEDRPILSPVNRRFWRAREVHRGNASVGFWNAVVLSIAWLIAFSLPVTAQSGGDPAKAQMQEMTRRQLQLNGPATDTRRPNDPKRSQAMMDQVSEDFQRILTLHNEIVRAIDSNKSLSYQFISDAMGEIRKRSSRLQDSLKLERPEPTEENRVLAPGVELMETKDELILICRQIESFIKNPIIETPGTVDAQQLEKARRDLESVVQLSGYIKKRADKQKH